MILFTSTMHSLCMIIILEICQVPLTYCFTKVNQKHSYNTRLASKISYSLPQARTNYGKFNIRYTGVKVWNSIDDQLKTLKNSAFKKNLKDSLLASYITLPLYCHLKVYRSSVKLLSGLKIALYYYYKKVVISILLNFTS